MFSPIKKFFAMDTAPGILLFIAAVVAVVIENAGLHGFYEALKHTPVVLQIGAFSIDKHLLHWINDGLMAIFFLLIGLEIKREIVEGHLSRFDQISLPAVAAIGGIAMPALIYTFINIDNPETIKGWAIPAATDIAFALGIMMILGKRVPASLKVCLVAVAIIDDLAAIIIIAVFYSGALSFLSLGLAALGLALALACNVMRVTNLSVYVVLGLFIWACVLKSGVHATLAGVCLGLIIPLRARNKNGKSPLKVMEHGLHPWVSFLVLPVFAFVNAGVSFAGLTPSIFLEPVTLGIILGLFVGKQLGVFLLTKVAVLCGLCKLPEGVTTWQFYGMSLLTGIGFTMSLFIGTLAFTDALLLAEVRLGVITGSILSAVSGVIVLILADNANKKKALQSTEGN